MLKYEKDGKGYKVFVNRGYGRSMGEMLEVLGGDADVEGKWIKVEKKGGGRFHIVDENMTVKKGDWISDATKLGFCGWDEEVTSLDNDSDEAQCFGMSNRLQWGNVTITTTSIVAKTIDELAEALSHVAFTAWCPGDI